MSYGLDILMRVLALVGGIFLIGVVITALIIVIENIKYKIDEKKTHYRIKHRFDKSPTAKCYCIDCVYYIEENHKCTHFRVTHIFDNYFCNEAKPRKKVKEC